LKDLPTRDVAEISWENNGVVYVGDSPEEAVKVSDDYAPEHLELHVRNTKFINSELMTYKFRKG